METETNYTIVGMFVIILTAILITGIIWFASGSPGKKTERYLVYVNESVSGLNKDASVKYRGVTVGKVLNLTLPADRPDTVRILVEIQKGTPVTTDTVATLEFQGITGLAYLNLSGGAPDAPVLTHTEGEEYPVIRNKPSLFLRIEERLQNPIEKLMITVDQVNKMLDDRNLKAFSDLLQNLACLTATADQEIKTIGDMLRDFSSVIPKVNQTNDELQATLGAVGQAANAARDMAETISTTSRTIQLEVKEEGERFGKNTDKLSTELVALSNEIKQTSTRLSSLAKQLEQRPQMLLFGKPQATKGPGE